MRKLSTTPGPSNVFFISVEIFADDASSTERQTGTRIAIWMARYRQETQAGDDSGDTGRTRLMVYGLRAFAGEWEARAGLVEGGPTYQ
jgi:hypothetical protein